MKDGSNMIIDFIFMWGEGGGSRRDLTSYVSVYNSQKQNAIHTLSKYKTFMLLRVELTRMSFNVPRKSNVNIYCFYNNNVIPCWSIMFSL